MSPTSTDKPQRDAAQLQQEIAAIKSRGMDYGLDRVQQLCPSVQLQKYLKHPAHPQPATPPLYLAVIEELMLYPLDFARASLQSTVQTLAATVSEEDLGWVHQLLANTLISAARHRYTNEYDRWLVQLAVNVLELNRQEAHLLRYFQAVARRVELPPGPYRDRGLVLSGYITDRQIIYHTAESGHFQEYIPTEPQVEEEDDALVEDSDSEETITTLAEYLQVIADPGFAAKPENAQHAVVLSLLEILPAEPLPNVSRHSRRLIELLGSFGTEPALQAISATLLVETVALDAAAMLYQRNRYSLYLRRLVALCLTAIVPKLRSDVAHQVLAYLSASERLSAEDVKLGVAALVAKLTSRVYPDREDTFLL